MFDSLASIFSSRGGALAAANNEVIALRQRLAFAERDNRNLQSTLSETQAVLNQTLVEKTKMMIDLKRLGREYYLAMHGARPIRSPFVKDQFDIRVEVTENAFTEMQKVKLARLVINETEANLATEYLLFHDTPDALAEEVASALIEEALRSLIPSIAEQLRQQL